MIICKGGDAMQLHIRQRIFSWTDRYDVQDETGEARYEVRSALFSLGHQIHVYHKRADEHQEEVGCIRQKLLTLMPAFQVEVNGQILGTVRREFTLFKPRYHVDYLGWDVEGDLMGWDYRVTKNGRQILSISKDVFRLSDTYTLTYADPSVEIPGLLLVLAIDAANCSHNE